MTVDQILAQVAGGTVKPEEAGKLLNALRPEAKTSMKVSEKGCVTFRGIPGANIRYGFSPRRETLEYLFAHEQQITEFIKKNRVEIDKRSAASRAAKEAA